MNEKRLEFSKVQDLNFITYNVLLILLYTKSVNSKKPFKDYRLLTHLIQIISDDFYFSAFKTFYNECLTPKGEYEGILKEIYIKSIENNERLKHILLMMENINLIKLKKEKNKITSLWLNDDEFEKSILENDIFDEEKKKICELLKYEKRIRTNQYSKFIERLYKDNGVDIWDI